MFKFEGEIKQLEGKIKWSVIYFPFPTLEVFGSKGNIPVNIIIDGHSFKHTLLPSRNGHYLEYNEFIKRMVGKDIGDIVSISLEKATAEIEFIIPEYIKKELELNGVLDTYLKQPNYLKREQVNYIEVAKKEETKNNRLKKLIERLST